MRRCEAIVWPSCGLRINYMMRNPFGCHRVWFVCHRICFGYRRMTFCRHRIWVCYWLFFLPNSGPLSHEIQNVICMCPSAGSDVTIQPYSFFEILSRLRLKLFNADTCTLISNKYRKQILGIVQVNVETDDPLFEDYESYSFFFKYSFCQCLPKYCCCLLFIYKLYIYNMFLFR